MKTIYLIKYLSLAILAAQLWTGCKISQDIAVPETNLPEGYSPGTADTTTAATLPWAQFYTNKELTELIAAAVENNNDLLVAVKSIDEAALVFRQTKWGNIPTLGVQAVATSNRPSDNSLNSITLGGFLHQTHVEDYTVAVALSWEADVWGKIRSQKAAALADLLQTTEARNAVQTRLVSDVAKGYYNLLMLDEQLSIAGRNVRLNDSTLRMIKLQYNAGQVTSLAVQQAEAQKLDAQRLIPQFEQQIAIQENALSILTGKYPHAIPHNEKLRTINVFQNIPSGVPAQLLSHRPDVKMTELDLSKLNAEVGYSKAAMYPSLAVTAQGGLNAFKANNWFEIPASLFGAVTGSVMQPLINQRKLRTQYQIAKVRREQAVLSFRQSLLNAVGEVSDNLIIIDKNSAQMTLMTQRVKDLELATSNSRMLFSNGLATYLEVITAQASVLQSELALAAIKKAQLDARVDLYRSIGGGWR